MLVKGRMSHPVITTKPDVPIMDALRRMQQDKVRRYPVVDKAGKLIGIVSDKDLLNAGPSDATSLSVWEVNYLMTKITVADVMTADVMTVAEDTAIEVAARIMVDNKIGGLPVMRGDRLVGLITETDLFKIFMELMGARDMGVRVTALIPDVHGELDVLTHSISEAGGEFIAFGMYSGDDSSNRLVTFKVSGMDETAVKEKIGPYIEELVDIRTCCE